MRWSGLYAPTLRQDPTDADAVSHRLLVRAGFIRQLMSGHYSLLPMAVRVRTKIMAVIRQELDRIGAQEWLLPAMHPAEIWRRTGRWDAMGDNLFRLTDRKGADLALGMTHEEIVATVAGELSSYRQLPQRWYQFQTKFRDEARPKSGLLRVREFTMKDSYSIDVDAAGLDRSFNLHHQAYQRIFERLRVPAIAVEASSGTMGGSDSVEFMCPTTAGEDLVVRCPACTYAANMEKATSRLAAVDDDATDGAPQRFETPGVRTIDDLTVHYGVEAPRQIKTLVYLLDGRLTLVLLRGDHALVEQKLIDATGAVHVRPAQPDEIRAALGALPGSLGAVGVTDQPVFADAALRGRRNMVTGANADNVHVRGVDVDRDITVAAWLDLREVTAGEPCPKCSTALDVLPTVEVGHIFKLGDKYTDVLGVRVSGPDGAEITPIMGSYGIGVERLMAAIVESHHDESGIVWPVNVAPFQVAVVVLGTGDPSVVSAGEDVYRQLLAAGVDAVLDDRDERAGIKFTDVELAGIPFRVTIGKRGIEAGTAEITARADGHTAVVPLAEIAGRLDKLLADAAAATWTESS